MACKVFPAARRNKKRPAKSSPPRGETRNGLQSFPRLAEKQETACKVLPATRGNKIHAKILSQRRREEIFSLQDIPCVAGKKSSTDVGFNVRRADCQILFRHYPHRIGMEE